MTDPEMMTKSGKSAELDDFMAKLKTETKTKYRDQTWNMLIVMAVGAGLAYWAYGTVAHTVLFTFLTFVVVSVKNATEQELHQFRSSIESKMIMDRLGM